MLKELWLKLQKCYFKLMINLGIPFIKSTKIILSFKKPR